MCEAKWCTVSVCKWIANCRKRTTAPYEFSPYWYSSVTEEFFVLVPFLQLAIQFTLNLFNGASSTAVHRVSVITFSRYRLHCGRFGDSYCRYFRLESGKQAHTQRYLTTVFSYKLRMCVQMISERNFLIPHYYRAVYVPISTLSFRLRRRCEDTNHNTSWHIHVQKNTSCKRWPYFQIPNSSTCVITGRLSSCLFSVAGNNFLCRRRNSWSPDVISLSATELPAGVATQTPCL
jgi:hypothetical protein